MSMKTPPSQRRSKRDPSAMLGRMTWMQVALGRHFGDDTEKIATGVRQALQDALANKGPFLQDADLGGDEPEAVVSMSGMFRMAVNEFDLDCSNRFERDIWATVVESALVDALAHKGSFGTEGFEQREAG